MTLPLSLFPLALPTFSRAPASPPPLPSAKLPPEDTAAATAAALEEFLARLDLYRPDAGAAPPSSRVSSAHGPLSSPGDLLSLTGLWNYAGFLSRKAVDVASDVLRHQLYGPKKKTWGLQMTVLSAVMRGMGKYSGLGNLALIRLLMSLPTYLPPSSEALITPITFRVKRRRLRGLLASADAAESGSREITAEWVVSKALWRRLNAEWKRAHSSSSSSSANTSKPGSRSQSQSRTAPHARVKGRVILYLHGGAYYVFNASTHRPITVPLSQVCAARVLAINYRLAPETRFPGPLHDAVSAYLRLTEDMHIPPSSILLAGDSAGGGLTLALAMYLRDNNYPLPAGMILMSPWVDLTMSSDSWESNAAFDIVPIPEPNSHMNPVINYLGPGESGVGRWLTHPYASPLFGEFAGLPPMLVQCGEAEVLRDEGALLAHKAASAGVDVEHEVFEDAVHVFQMLPFLPQTGKAFECVRAFVRGKVAREVRRMRVEECAGGNTTTTTTTTTTTMTAPATAGSAGNVRPAFAPDASLAAPAREPEEPSHPATSLDAESVALTGESMVVTGAGKEVALGKEPCTREMEAGESGSDSELELDATPRLPLPGEDSPSASPELEQQGEEQEVEQQQQQPRRSKSAQTLPLPPPSPQRPRQHRRQPSYPSSRPRRSTHTHAVPPSPSALGLGMSMSASYSTQPVAISPRSRALSHPELKELVRSYWEAPGVRTVRWSLVGGGAGAEPEGETGTGAGAGAEGEKWEELQRAAAADGAMEDRL